jgi:hypothetical protein
LTKTIDYCKFWDDKIIVARFKINRGNLIILGLYDPTEGRKGEAENYQQLQDIIFKINKRN